jgi:hypothetical protein
VVQTFGDRSNVQPHVHALGTRGGWTDSGEWVPVPYVDEGAAEELFRHKVLGLLRHRGLPSQDRIELLLSWRRGGFSVHNQVFAHPAHGRDFEALVRYMMRSPVCLTRLRFTPGAKEVVYARKGGHDASEPGEDDRVDAEDFVARIPRDRAAFSCSRAFVRNRRSHRRAAADGGPPRVRWSLRGRTGVPSLHRGNAGPRAPS